MRRPERAARRSDRGRRGRPQALAIRSTSIASARPSGGRIEGRRRAASDLPAPGRADDQQAVAARGRDLERAAQVRLAAQVGEVRAPGAGAVRRSRPAAGGAAARPRCRAARAARAASSGTTRGPRGERRLAARSAPGPTIASRARRGAPPRPSPALPGTGRIEPSSASSPASATSVERSARAAGRRRRAAPPRSRGRSPGPALRRSAGREVGGDPLLRELEPGVGERRAHALARLAHRGVGQARRARSAGRPGRDVDLDLDLARLDAEEREGAGDREHAAKLGAAPRAVARRSVRRGHDWHDLARHGARGARLASAPMTDARQRLGRAAEELVADALERRGARSSPATRGPRGARRARPDRARRRRRWSSSRSRRCARRSWPGPSGRRWRSATASAHKLRALALAWLRDTTARVPRHRALRFDVVGARALDARAAQRPSSGSTSAAPSGAAAASAA